MKRPVQFRSTRITILCSYVLSVKSFLAIIGTVRNESYNRASVLKGRGSPGRTSTAAASEALKGSPLEQSFVQSVSQDSRDRPGGTAKFRPSPELRA